MPGNLCQQCQHELEDAEAQAFELFDMPDEGVTEGWGPKEAGALLRDIGQAQALVKFSRRDDLSANARMGALTQAEDALARAEDTMEMSGFRRDEKSGALANKIEATRILLRQARGVF